MDEKKKMELTRLQGGMAIASFSAGVGIALGCLFFIEPLGASSCGAARLMSRSLSPARGPVTQPRFVPKTIQPPPSR